MKCSALFSLIILGASLQSAQAISFKNVKEKLASLKHKEKIGSLIKKDCSLKSGIASDCYYKREEAKLKAVMIYYGSNYWQDSDLQRFASIYSERFKKATHGELEVEVVRTKVIPFAHNIPFDYSYNGITDAERLKRIWYWENFNTGVGLEIEKIFRASEGKDELANIDLLLVVTGAQADGNGFAAGRAVVVEQPMEISWGSESKGRTDDLSDYKLADILIHETGHFLGIGHAAEHCVETGLSLSDRVACCANAPSGKDVMSYCRDREVNEERINTFEACTMDIIKNEIKPRILSGDKRRIAKEIHCK